jgi:2-keto-4-pentenoate hydratase/2-oxohepta-3-ene-1,7-dioic acid hydratase in catechol pathway
MKWVRYSADNTVSHGAASYGILEGDRIIEVRGTPFGEYERTATRRDLAAVRLLAPVIPPTLYAAGMNYATHVKEALELLGNTVTAAKKPDIGYRAVNAIIGPDERIVIPKDSSGVVQFEGELAVVIGKRAKHLSEEDALSCVLGYTIGNDVSERTWQASDRTLWRAKNTDTFKPMGPVIETDVDLESLVTRITVNGTLQSEFRTNNMIVGVARYLSTMSRYLTLHPGDVVWMGAEAPCGDMVPGDTVEIEITGIGTLRNPVTGEA